MPDQILEMSPGEPIIRREAGGGTLTRKLRRCNLAQSYWWKIFEESNKKGGEV
jgi:hypothetical protein